MRLLGNVFVMSGIARYPGVKLVSGLGAIQCLEFLLCLVGVRGSSVSLRKI